MADSEFAGFTKGETVAPFVETGIPLAQVAQARLKEIMSWVEVGHGGGDFLITDLNTGRSYRLTFCDFTGQQKCTACGGTGVEGSNFNPGPSNVNQN